MSQSSKVLRFDRYRWDSVETREYKTEGTHFREITRQTLLGEGPGEEPLRYLTRYFEIQPGGYSSLERHRHPHVVMVIRGSGRVVLGSEVHPIGPFDCVYIAPATIHQFQATGGEPLGFVCIVDRERDRPELVRAEEADNDAARS
jgi:mannose-6-phosphate isomerase-like protein (cupin superfamily)